MLILHLILATPSRQKHSGSIIEKIQEVGLRWHGHMMRREDESCMKRMMMQRSPDAAVGNDRRTDRGDTIQQDLKKEDTGDRKKWRGRISVAYPSLKGINSSLERDILCPDTVD